MVIFQRRVPNVIGALILLTLVTSIAAAVDARHGGALYQRLALVPARVWRGELWRLVTWTLVERSPWALIFACVSVFWFGGDLHGAWRGDRFVRFVGAVVLVASAGTSLAALAIGDAWRYPHLGGWALGDALVIAWALQFPARRLRVWGLFVIGGEPLAYGVFALAVLCGVFYGAAPFLPEILAGGVALGAMSGTWGRWRNGLVRRYRRRHLRVVRDEPPRWN